MSIRSLLTVSFAALTLAACGQQAPQSKAPSTPASTGATAPAAVQPATPAAPEQKKEEQK